MTFAFLAPIERAAAVGNVVKATKPSIMRVEVPPFIANAFNIPYGESIAATGADDLMETHRIPRPAGVSLFSSTILGIEVLASLR